MHKIFKLNEIRIRILCCSILVESVLVTKAKKTNRRVLKLFSIKNVTKFKISEKNMTKTHMFFENSLINYLQMNELNGIWALRKN